MPQTEDRPRLRLRAEIPEEFRWDVGRIYASDAAWETALGEAEQLLQQAEEFPGTLAQSAQRLLQYLQYQDALSQQVEKLYVYASLRHDEDQLNQHYQDMRDRCEGLLVRANQRLAFFLPELFAIEPQRLAGYLAEETLSGYRIYLEELLRLREHTLSPREETLLAGTTEMAAAFDNTYSVLCDAELPFPIVTNEQGEQEQLSHGNYIRLLQSHDRQVRKQAFEAMYQTYARFGATIASLYAASVKKDVFYARAHRYPDSLTAALYGDAVPLAVYEQLIATVREHQGLFARYLDIRRRALGVERLHLYDVYVPLLPEPAAKISFAEAKQIVEAAVAPLGEEYGRILKQGLDGGWVDVYESKGKASGAYSGGCYGTDPYILMNFQDDLQGVFTLAHEAGHSLHSYLSRQAQPYIYSDYRIFVAEVASTVNENLLIDHLLSRAESKKQVLLLLNHFLEEFRGTVFRQTMFAEFELEAHRLAEQGEALTMERLNQLYYRLNCDYFGDGVEVDPLIAYEWMRIPHFYRPYYVYKYATGFCAASALALGLIAEDPAKQAEARERYLQFLRAGSSAQPIELLRRAGVDMTQAEPLRAALGLFGQLLDSLEGGLGYVLPVSSSR